MSDGCRCHPADWNHSHCEKSFEMEFTFSEPLDPELLKLLYGDQPVPPQYALTITTPIKRKWWERLLRRPQQYSVTHIPHAVMTLSDDAA